MCQVFKVFLPLVCVILSHSLVLAQTGYSPYSIRGIGDINDVGLSHNRAMGGIGISNGSSFHYNNANPALLYRNSLSVFAIGMIGEYNEIATSDLSQENYSGGFNYALLGLPLIVDKWTVGLGIMPYSTVNYKYSVSQAVVGNSAAMANKNYTGSGGFNKAFLSNGVKITDNLSVGVTVGYLFGSIKDEVETQVVSQRRVNDTTVVNVNSNRAITTERLTIGDLYLMGGLAYRLPLKNKTAINFGATYELGGDKGTKVYKNVRNTVSREIDPFANDTIIDTRGNVKLPTTLGIGFSYERIYNWTVGADVVFRNWSTYQSSEASTEEFDDNFTISVGAEYIPDISSVDNYLKRMAYRIGITNERSPFSVNNEYINDFGINFGVSLPVRNYSSFDLSFQLGQRGTIDNDLIRERYVRVYLGVTFNDKWFVRRKFD